MGANQNQRKKRKSNTVESDIKRKNSVNYVRKATTTAKREFHSERIFFIKQSLKRSRKKSELDVKISHQVNEIG